jgi:hypothetical protein
MGTRMSASWLLFGLTVSSGAWAGPVEEAERFSGTATAESLAGRDERADYYIEAGVRFYAEHAALNKCQAAGHVACIILESSLSGSCRSHCTAQATAQGTEIGQPY